MGYKTWFKECKRRIDKCFFVAFVGIHQILFEYLPVNYPPDNILNIKKML